MKIHRGAKFLTAAIACLFLFTAAVRAQNNPVTLTVSPPLFELSANPGDTLKNSVRLENPTDSPRKVAVEFRNFTAYGEEGSVDLTEEDTSYSLKDWMPINPNGEVTIPAKGSQTYNFTIDVPANAEPGGHFGSIVFKTKVTDSSEEGSGARVEQELGSLVLVKVAGDIKEDIGIESFNSTKSLWESGPVDLEARLKNGGNVHTKPTGTIVITNSVGKQVASIPMEEKNILPGAIRKTVTKWQPSGFTIGRFNAQLTVVFDGGNKIVTANTTFWVIPYKTIAIFALIIGAIAFVIVRYRKRISAAVKVLRGKH